MIRRCIRLSTQLGLSKANAAENCRKPIHVALNPQNQACAGLSAMHVRHFTQFLEYFFSSPGNDSELAKPLQEARGCGTINVQVGWRGAYAAADGRRTRQSGASSHSRRDCIQIRDEWAICAGRLAPNPIETNMKNAWNEIANASVETEPAKYVSTTLQSVVNTIPVAAGTAIRRNCTGIYLRSDRGLG